MPQLLQSTWPERLHAKAPRRSAAAAAACTAARVSGVTGTSPSSSKNPIRFVRNSSGFGSRNAIGRTRRIVWVLPQSVRNSRATSLMVRAMGPMAPRIWNGPTHGGKCPRPGIRPGVGLSEQIPVKCAAHATHPPLSLPNPAADSPQQWPPTRPRSTRPAYAQGPMDCASVRGAADLRFRKPFRNSGQLVVPRINAPAARSRGHNHRVVAGISPSWERLQCRTSNPRVAIEDFTVTGNPEQRPCAHGCPRQPSCSRARSPQHDARRSRQTHSFPDLSRSNLPYVRLGQLNYRNLARFAKVPMTCRRRKEPTSAHGRPAEFRRRD